MLMIQYPVDLSRI